MPILARWFALALLIPACLSRADGELSADAIAAINKAAIEALADTGAPAASIAIIKDGKIAYHRAYGLAEIKPPKPASPVMRFRIGSISKQFVATAVLMLAEEQKLSLDDKIDRWFPDLTRANEVTIRQLLSMTAGYQDYWPQDYLIPPMLTPIAPADILKTWAHKPLDFDPGSKWQYSNTNYVIAGLIVEKVAGVSLFDFLQKRIFKPLKMTTVVDTLHGALPAPDASGYLRYALGPLRPAPMEGAGWLFASADLAMTAEDLATWDLSVINQQLLKPESYRIMQSEVQLNSAIGTHYGLGVGVRIIDDHRVIWHDGLVSGFTTQNYIYPDDKAAIVVLTNLNATPAADRIAGNIAGVIFPNDDPGAQAAAQQARAIFQALQRGKIDRSLFTENANAYFTDEALKDFATSLAPLGPAPEFAQAPMAKRGGMTLRRFRARFLEKSVDISTYTTAEGKLDQYLVAPPE
jgi:CubicO group peptidase (beta-lactamase class C family)